MEADASRPRPKPRPKPRPDHLEAKARTVKDQGQGHDFWSSSSKTVLEDPIRDSMMTVLTVL